MMQSPHVTFLCLLLPLFSICPSHSSQVDEPPSTVDSDDVLAKLRLLETISQLKAAEDDVMDKRQSSFMRIGRGGAGNFLRIGRPNSGFVRIGRPSGFVRIGKPSGFVRIGKPSGFMRIGKPSGFVRIGKSDEEFGSQPDYGPFEKRFNSQPLHRFIRIGRSSYSGEGGGFEEELPGEEKRASSFLRIGKSPNSFVRIGKSADDNDDDEESQKRASNFMRIGKSSASADDSAIEDDKRPSGFVRIGKTPAGVFKDDDVPKMFADDFNPTPEFLNGESTGNDLDTPDKRKGNFLRIGKSSPDGQTDEIEESDSPDTDKRASSFLRIGKSPNSFVRIGKSPNSFVRIGKSPNSFVRIGKSPNSFVRIGKAPHSFMRIGK